MLVKSLHLSILRGFCRSPVNRLKMSTYQEKLVKVDGTNIFYIKTGQGPKNLMLLPGALGTFWSDFKPQIEGLDKNKFTVYAWDPPGYGKSRPPTKSFDIEFFEKDAKAAVSFMKSVGAEKFTPVGWSDGGITALIMAAKYKENMDKLIVLGANVYVTQTDIDLYEGIRDLAKWSTKMREPLEAVYGAREAQELWASWIDGMTRFLTQQDGDICKTLLPKIEAKTLVIHGNKDSLVPDEHPKYILENIRNAKIHYFPDGKHNLHLKYAKEFNQLVEDFMTD